jgi:thiol-disulfide isomerase/thioredoxin
MYYAPWCGHCKKLAPVWSELADYVQGSELTIAKLDATEEKISDPHVKSYPTIFFYPKGEDKIAYDGKRDLLGLQIWLSENSTAFKSHFPDWKPILPSEDPPESNDGAVKILVGSTHDEIVQDSTKDVLIMYYAPWCPHCQNLEPIWDQLGESLVGSHVLIGKMDWTKNKVDSINVSSYPTLMWYPMGYKKGIESKAGRNLKQL